MMTSVPFPTSLHQIAQRRHLCLHDHLALGFSEFLGPFFDFLFQCKAVFFQLTMRLGKAMLFAYILL